MHQCVFLRQIQGLSQIDKKPKMILHLTNWREKFYKLSMGTASSLGKKEED